MLKWHIHVFLQFSPQAVLSVTSVPKAVCLPTLFFPKGKLIWIMPKIFNSYKYMKFRVFFFFFFFKFKQCSPETQMVGIFHDYLFQYYRLLWFIKAITKVPILIRNKFKPIQLPFVHAYGWLRKQFLEKVVAVHV